MAETKVILAIDTATGPCSTALWKAGKVAGYLENKAPVMQSACLMPMIEELLKQTGTAYPQLSAVACTIGPGSFTGIRVGLAAARGICFAAKIKGLGFTTLETLAQAAKKEAGDKPILSLLNAGKGEVYYQAFAAAALYEPRIGTIAEALASAPDALVAGNMEIGGRHIASAAYPRADALAELAALHASPAQSLSPFYIRAPDAKLPTRAL